MYIDTPIALLASQIQQIATTLYNHTMGINELHKLLYQLHNTATHNSSGFDDI